MRTTAVRILSAAALITAAACDGDSTGGARLRPADVGAVYRVCTLRFVPENTVFPAADLLQRVVYRTPPAGKPEPTLTLSPNASEFELIYTRQSDAFTQQLRGSVAFGTESVRPQFYSDDNARGEIPAELLLPARPTLRFETNPRRLTTADGAFFFVSRRDYATAAGIGESGLAAQIYGRLDATFREGSCG